MRIRFTVVLSAIALFLAACGAGVGTEADRGVTLRYGYEPGNILVFDTAVELSLTMIAGDEATAMESATTGTMTYEFTEGPEPDTLVMSVTVETLAGSGTAGIGATTIDLPNSEVIAGPVTLTYVFNARGEIVDYSLESDAIPPGLMEVFGGVSLEGTPAQYIGPPLPDGPVEIGSEWTTDLRTEVIGIEFGTVSRHRIAALEEMGGRTTYRIDTITTGLAFEGDLTPLLADIAENPDWIFEMMGDEASEQDREELATAFAMIEIFGVEILYRMPETIATQTTWFDAATGTVVRMDLDQPTEYSIVMRNIPGEDDIEMTLQMESTTTMVLTR